MADQVSIRQGESFILQLILQNDDLSPVLVSMIKSFKITAFVFEKPVATWTWTPTESDPHLIVTDGLAKLEVEGPVTSKWLHSIEFEVQPVWVDSAFFVSGGQRDVACIDGLLKVVPC